MKNLIKLGGCRRPHGIKGGFLFYLFSGQETILKRGMEVTLVPENFASVLPREGQKHVISNLVFGAKIIAYLKEVSSRNQVEALIPFEILLPREDFPVLEESEFYLSDLLGLKVVDHRTKEEMGTVKGVSDNTVQTILEVRGKINIDLPFVDSFFPAVDLELKFIEIIVPEVIEV